MQKFKTSLLSAAILMMAVACQKNDHHELEAPATVTESPATAWTAPASWTALSESEATQYTELKDSTVSASVLEHGLVLVYKKNNAGASVLPFEEQAEGASINWYYQADEGRIRIFREGKAAAGAPAFRFLVITPEQLQALEAKGMGASQLMGLELEAVQSLLQ